jgi:mersacidin/lichenicidin family type 2 lantibiotic
MKVDIIRAWKDEAYRMSLSQAERAALPANPAGEIELSEADLDHVVGGKLMAAVAFQYSALQMLRAGSGGGGGTGNGTGGNCSKVACCQ